MKIPALMEAYQNGERKPVLGPLDYLQALSLVQMNRRLMSSLAELVRVNQIAPDGTQQPVAVRAKAHYEACAVLAQAEDL